MIISSIFCIIVSFLLVWYFTRRNYIPLLQLVKKALPDFGPRQGNEFHILQNHIDSIHNENTIMEQELLAAHSLAEKTYLANLMLGTYSPNEFLLISGLPIWRNAKADEKLNLAVLLFSVDNTSDDFDLNQEEDQNLLRFILKNILEDLIDRDMHWQSSYIGRNLLLVIHEQHSILQKLCSSIASQMPALLNAFNLRVQIGISIGIQPLAQAHLLYKEAQKALEYCHLYDSPHTIYQENIDRQNLAALHAKTVIDAQYKFQNVLLAQNYEAAMQMLPELFTGTFSREQNISQVRLNIYALISLYQSCLLKLSEKDPSLASVIDNQMTALLNNLSLDELKNQFLNCLQELNNRKTEERLCEQDSLVEEMKEYIQTNYSDNTLSAGGIADHFEMPLSTVSKLFKKQTQTGILDYIHQVRIEQAKLLLQTQKYTVNEVAEMTGYLSASTFIRIFKKYEGISPGTLLR